MLQTEPKMKWHSGEETESMENWHQPLSKNGKNSWPLAGNHHTAKFQITEIWVSASLCVNRNEKKVKMAAISVFSLPHESSVVLHLLILFYRIMMFTELGFSEGTI